MAEDKTVKQLAEVDYVLRKYYQENMAGILSGVVKDVRTHQANELAQIERDTSPIIGAGSAVPDARNLFVLQRAKNAEWGSKTTDDMMQMAMQKMLANPKTAHDLAVMASVWKLRIVENIGEQKYTELSANTMSGDLAMDIVLKRLNDQMIEQLAKSNVPSGTLDYIVRKGFEGSLFGMMARQYTNSSTADVQVKDMVEKMYGASAGTIFAGHAMSFVLDAPTYFIGSGSAKAISALVGTDVLIKGYESYSEWKEAHEDTYKEFSKTFFGDENGMSQVVDQSRKVNAKTSTTVSVVNSHLSKKLRLPFDNDGVKSQTGQFSAYCDGNGSDAKELVTAHLSAKGLAYLPNKKVPDWMMKKCSEEACVKNAGFYLALADEMNSKGLAHMKVGQRDMTLKEVTQQAYDYARAADLKHQTAPRSETEQIVDKMEENEAYMRSVGLLPSDSGGRQQTVADSQILLSIRSSLHKNGLPYVPDRAWPKWMDGMSVEDLEKNAKRWRNLAVQTQSQKKATLNVKGVGEMTLQELTQRAYDYARAADAKIKAERMERQQTQAMEEEWDRNMAMINAALEMPADNGQQQDPYLHKAAQVTYSKEEQQAQFLQQYQQHYQQPMSAAAAAPQQQDFGGWGNLLNKTGLDGLSNLGSGLGSTIAMLPELMVGLFTGKIPGFTMKDNALPLGLMAFSLLFGKRMNPMLKFLMLGLGGAMLLNNANKVRTGETSENVQRATSYRRYDDEPLNPRMTNVEMKGNTILADIDGVPTILTIKSDRVLDAYNKGAIPLNTLCNAALRNYDQMDVRASESYERVAALQNEEQQEQVRGIR